MEQFKEKLIDILDVDDISDEDVLEDFDEWDSLSILTVISYVGSTFNKTLTAKEIRDCKTVKDLYEGAGEAVVFGTMTPEEAAQKVIKEMPRIMDEAMGR